MSDEPPAAIVPTPIPAPRPPGFWGWVSGRARPFANSIKSFLSADELVNVWHNAGWAGIGTYATLHALAYLMVHVAPLAASLLPWPSLSALVAVILVAAGQSIGRAADNTDGMGNKVPAAIVPRPDIPAEPLRPFDPDRPAA